MKKILILCMVLIFAISGVVSAEVRKGKDSFTNGLSVSSWQYPKPEFNVLSFQKELSGITYELSISRVQIKKYILGNAPIEIKIDEYPVYELKDYRYKLTGPDSYGVEYNSVINVKFPTDIADKIKDAKRVAIRYEDAMGMRWPYVLPDNVLAEWKEVINTEE